MHNVNTLRIQNRTATLPHFSIFLFFSKFAEKKNLYCAFILYLCIDICKYTFTYTFFLNYQNVVKTYFICYQYL